jgi:hypothetical protein
VVIAGNVDYVAIIGSTVRTGFTDRCYNAIRLLLCNFNFIITTSARVRAYDPREHRAAVSTDLDLRGLLEYAYVQYHV